MNQIYIFGLGAIGSNLLLQLVKKYPDFTFIGIDYDKVEERNILTQAYLTPHIGILKTHAMTAILGLNSPAFRKFGYSPISVKVESENQLCEIMFKNASTKGNLYIDCFDNAFGRKLFKARNDDILHIGFSPQYTAEIIWNENYTSPNDIPEDQDDICEMPDAVPFINFVVSLACMNISNFIANNVKKDLIITDKYRIKELN